MSMEMKLVYSGHELPLFIGASHIPAILLPIHKEAWLNARIAEGTTDLLPC